MVTCSVKHHQLQDMRSFPLFQDAVWGFSFSRMQVSEVLNLGMFSLQIYFVFGDAVCHVLWTKTTINALPFCLLSRDRLHLYRAEKTRYAACRLRLLMSSFCILPFQNDGELAK
jgi:hypothetical protein